MHLFYKVPNKAIINDQVTAVICVRSSSDRPLVEQRSSITSSYYIQNILLMTIYGKPHEVVSFHGGPVDNLECNVDNLRIDIG